MPRPLDKKRCRTRILDALAVLGSVDVEGRRMAAVLNE